MKTEKRKVKYPCSRCDEGSSYENDNQRDAKGKLVCRKCAHEDKDGMFVRMLNHTPPVVSLSVGEITIWYNAMTGRVTSAWTRYGMNGINTVTNRPFPGAIRELQEMLAENKAQCAVCKEIVDRDTLKQARMHGAQCPDCYAKWEVRCEAERKSGNVCRLCRTPRSACCC